MLTTKSLCYAESLYLVGGEPPRTESRLAVFGPHLRRLAIRKCLEREGNRVIRAFFATNIPEMPVTDLPRVTFRPRRRCGPADGL